MCLREEGVWKYQGGNIGCLCKRGRSVRRKGGGWWWELWESGVSGDGVGKGVTREQGNMKC